MSEQDIDKIRKLAENHSVTPRPEAWNKLNEKLKARKNRTKLHTYRNISIAAIMISVLSVTVVFSMYLGNHNPDVFSSNERFEPIMIEELTEVDNNPFYDVKYVDQLHNAYSKLGFK